MTGENLRLGEALTDLLIASGIRAIFGIPGVHNVELFRGIEQKDVRLVVPRHEQGAGFMADGFARASGQAAACYTITGPGLTNILTPMGQAYSDSVPMLVIASALKLKDAGRGRGRLHEMRDQLAAARSVTDLAFSAHNGEALKEALGYSLTEFRTGRPRPAYIEIPLDLLGNQEELPGSLIEVTPAGTDRAQAEQVRDIARHLLGARRPVLLVGGGAQGASGEIRKLIDRTPMAVVTTASGKGIVPESHGFSLGARLPHPKVQDFLCQADLVVLIGTELAETDLWHESELALSGKIVRVDVDARHLSMGPRADYALKCDAGAFVRSLYDALGEEPTACEITRAEIAALKSEHARSATPLRKKHNDVLAAMRRALPAETVIASDMTQLAYSANEVFALDHPRCWLHPVGFGTLGYAVPAAIGAKIARPEVPVAALIGDYGVQYTINELAVAVAQDCPILIFLWVNEALAEIRDDMLSRQIAPAGTSLQNPDFALLAEAYGVGYGCPANLAELESATRDALGRSRPTLIEIREERF